MGTSPMNHAPDSRIPSRRVAVALLAAFALAVLASRHATLAASQPRPLSSFDPQAKPLLAQMTLDEKIGQMTQPDQEFIKDLTDIETYSFGSILSGGSSDPKEGNSLEAWTDLYDRLQKHALNTRLHIPLLYGIDAVHGHNNVLGAVIFPHNIGLGCTRNAALVEKVERITAEEVRATGIQWAFAPCVTVPQDDRWGRTYEGFSEDPALVQRTGRSGGPRLPGRRPGQPARRSGLRQALRRRRRHGLRIRRRTPAPASTRATRAWTKPPCAAFICPATSRP